MTVPLFDALQTYEELDGISRRSPLSDALPAALCSRAVRKTRLGETIRGNRGANHTVRLSKKGTAPATRGVFAQNLGRANCHTRVADRYTAHCTCHRREENDPRR